MISATAVPYLRLVPSTPPSEEPPPLGQNLVMYAGAGAGKTHSLLTICLRILGGARQNGVPLEPRNLFLLTFTEKAADEMRQRLRSRLDALAQATSPEASEPELCHSFAQLGRPTPPAAFWRHLSDELGTATIGTFHSLCVQLLRRAPMCAAVDPAFRILDERESGRLLRDVAEREALEALENLDPQIVEMCTELGFSGAYGFVDLLVGTLGKLREEGQELDRVAIGDEAAARAELVKAIEHLRRITAEASALDRSGKRRFAVALSRCEEALSEISFENFPRCFERLRLALESEPHIAKQHGALGECLKELKHRALGSSDKKIDGLRDFYGQAMVVPYEAAFRALLGRADLRYGQELRRRAALDFSGILICTRDLLRNDPVFRGEVQRRIGALLVDEFQDTNRLQLEIVTLLSERRSAGPRDLKAELPLEREWGTSGIQQLPLEPGFLCVVGDRKQSIYEFRGADVTVFGRLADHLVREGGGTAYLRDNWRSTPALLDFFNRISGALMRGRADGRNYEVKFTDEDELLPIRPSGRSSPPVERICFDPPDGAVEARLLEADLLARRICQLLRPEGPRIIAGSGGALCPTRGGDIAILFRRFSFLEVYRQALIRYRIPHRVVRGRGFYAAQEVLDIASFLTLLSDRRDAIALAAVLRSPFVALSDESLFRIAWSSGQRLKLDVFETDRWQESNGLSEAEVRRLRVFLRSLERLRTQRHRLELRQLIRLALEETGYRVGIAASPFGEQSLANIDKLLEIASERESSGRGNLTEFARELVALVDADPGEAQADILDDGDPNAVELMTIHQAKGLEWPVVAIADLAAQRPRSKPGVIFDRDLGLAVRPWLLGETRVSSPRFRKISEELDRREDAESLRLLYVAMTRARDHLILSGRARSEAGTWRQQIDSQIASFPEIQQRVTDLSAKDLEVTRLEAPGAPLAEKALEEQAEKILTRIRNVNPSGSRSVVFPVTVLQDFFLCPRRYHYRHRVGLCEFPILLDLDDPESTEGERGVHPKDARHRGTFAHKLLERVTLGLSSEERLRRELEELTGSLGINPRDEYVEEIVRSISAFMLSPFMAKVIAGGQSRVHRELPFLLRLADTSGQRIHLKGTIDLLWENDQGGATIIDYKYSEPHPKGLWPYLFQLDCYALAAAQLVKPGLAIDAGIVFLRGSHPTLELRQSRQGSTLEEFEARLIEGVTRLAALGNSGDWPGLNRASCEAIRCGYQYRCHPGATT